MRIIFPFFINGLSIWIVGISATFWLLAGMYVVKLLFHSLEWIETIAKPGVLAVRKTFLSEVMTSRVSGKIEIFSSEVLMEIGSKISGLLDVLWKMSSTVSQS